MEKQYLDILHKDMRSLFRRAFMLSLGMPSLTFPFSKMLFNQWKAARRRAALRKQGTHVPVFMILSVTKRCNLSCGGCYAKSLGEAGGEMDPGKLRDILREARALGISIILVSGGEPLMRGDLLDLLKEFSDLTFVLFTNGTMLSSSVAGQLARSRNVIPVLSFEGGRASTDGRRGRGVFDSVSEAVKNLKKHNIFFGVSVTVSKENFSEIFQGDFVKKAAAEGSSLFFFVEYVPVDSSSGHLVVPLEMRGKINGMLAEFRKTYPALFFAFPGGEEEYGGCIAAGRGFIHIAPTGAVEPCPFSPVSDVSLRDKTLKDALGSELLRKIRENKELRKETAGGCALWANREIVASLVSAETGESETSGK